MTLCLRAIVPVSSLSRIISAMSLLPAALTMAAAQVANPMLVIPQSDTAVSVRLGYERQLNTFTGTGDARAAGDMSILRYDIRQQVRSRLVRVPGSPRQDEYSGYVELSAPLVEGLEFQLLENSTVLGGSRGAGIEAIAQHRLLGGPVYQPGEMVRVRGLAGWEWNGQQDRNDAGLSLAGRIDAGDLDLEGLLVNGSASWIRSDLGERKPEDANTRIRLLSTFQGGGGDSLEVSYRRQVRDLYSGTGTVQIPGSTTLLRRSEDILTVRNSLWFLSERSLEGAIEGGLVQRGIDRSFRQLGDVPGPSFPLPTTIDQLMIDVLGRVQWEPIANTFTRFGAGFASGEETHDVRELDAFTPFEIDAQRAQARRRSNRYERYFTSMGVESGLMPDLSIRLEGSASLLRYETPDTLNTDDRDEQRISAGLGIYYIVNPGLLVSATLEAGQSHLVYLSRYQSANNVRIRTLRFAPVIVWASRSGFRNALHTEIAASYTVYDYEDRISSVQSFSYRQAAWTDSLTVSLSTRLGLEFFGSLRLFERGILRWSDFTERPQRAFLELYIWPQLRYAVWDEVALGIGFRSFRQQRYQYVQNVRVYDGAVGSFGPTVSVSAGLGTSWISMTGWRETQHVNGAETRSLSNVSLTVETRL